MPSIAEIRQQTGDAYSDMSDEQLGSAIYKKFYSDMPRAEFNQKVGLAPPEDVTAGMALRGVPVLGAYVPQAEAAIRATAQPLSGVGQPGETWRKRYEANLPQREQQYKQAEQDAPITSEALKIGGGMAALAPVGATAAGARALGMVGGLPARMGFGAASGAGLSAADALARGGSPQEAIEAGKWGGGIGAAAAPLAAGLSRIVTPSMQADPVRRAAVQTLREAGVTPRAGDVIENRPLQWAEQHLGPMAGRGPEVPQEQLTQAAFERAGFQGRNLRLTQDRVDQAFNQVGNEFDRLAAGHTLPPDNQFGTELGLIVRGYQDVVAPTNRAPIVGKYLGEIVDHFDRPQGAPGDIYQSLRSRIEKAARETSDEPTQSALRGFKLALDDLMERHLAAMNSPDLGAWQAVRNQYRNLLVLDRAAVNPNVVANNGRLTPAALYQATQQVQGMRNMSRGRGDLQPLANAAANVMRQLPSSGTSERGLVTGAAIGATGGAGGLLFGDNPGDALKGAALGLAPFAAGRAITSPLAQRYFQNAILPTPAAHGAFRGAAAGGLMSLLPYYQQRQSP